MEVWNINNHILEYDDDTHTYIVDGIIVPSITQILKHKFSNKYAGVDAATLQNAAAAGTAVHLAIQEYEEQGKECDLQELRDYKFLKKQYEFNVLKNEVPVLIELDGEVVAAGRLDLVLEKDFEIGLGDIKRTSVLDMEYLAYQLNLYRIGYQQCYSDKITFLRALHLRKGVRKYKEIPIKEKFAIDLLKDYLETRRENNEC